MSEEKWTPGKWEARAKGHRWIVGAAGSLGGSGAMAAARVLWDVAAGSPSGGNDQKEANAHLIAAAPDLFACVRYMEARLAINNPNDGLLHDCRAALAKARGES